MTAFKCLTCGNRLPNRVDAHFCSAACRAAYHRAYGKPQPDIHADLPPEHAIQCAVCGDVFDVNAYAYRGGERQARYCSGRCRQKAYRERKGT